MQAREEAPNQQGDLAKNAKMFGWTGWWFGTFSIFPYIGNNHPIDSID